MELSPSYHLSPPAAPTDAAQPKHNCKDRHYASPNQTLTHNQHPHQHGGTAIPKVTQHQRAPLPSQMRN